MMLHLQHHLRKPLGQPHEDGAQAKGNRVADRVHEHRNSRLPPALDKGPFSSRIFCTWAQALNFHACACIGAQETPVAAAHPLNDAVIGRAQQRLWREPQLAVEPAAVLGLASLSCCAVQPQPRERVLLLQCRANFDPEALTSEIR